MASVAQAVAPKLNSVESTVVKTLMDLRQYELSLLEQNRDVEADAVARSRWNLADAAIEIRNARIAASKSKSDADQAAKRLSNAATKAKKFVSMSSDVAALLSQVGNMIKLLAGLVALVG